MTHLILLMVYRIKCLILTLFVFLSIAGNDYIVELNDGNFKQFIQSHPFVMVKFYNPGCSNCKAMAPEYDKVAANIYNSKRPYIIAGIQVSTNENTANEQMISQLPALKLFIRGKPIDYLEERQADIMLRFIDNSFKKHFSSHELLASDEITAKLALREIHVDFNINS